MAYIKAVMPAAFIALALSLALGGVGTAGRRAGAESVGRSVIKPEPPEAERAASSRLEAIKNIPADLFEAHEFRAGNNVTLKYRLLRPKGYKQGVKYPLVVVFHGSGAIGDDNVRHLGVVAKSWAQDEYREKYPCFVLAPQFASRPVVYVRQPGEAVDVSVAQPPMHAAVELTEKLIGELGVERSRVYIMGYSMGGSATWHALSLRPKTFAAAVPIAGIPNPRSAAQITEIPVWVIHGNRDDENPFAGDDLMYRALVKRGARRVRFWELDGVGHEVPASVFVAEGLHEWLFAQRRRGGN